MTSVFVALKTADSSTLFLTDDTTAKQAAKNGPAPRPKPEPKLELEPESEPGMYM